jgi:hypothetical protein
MEKIKFNEQFHQCFLKHSYFLLKETHKLKSNDIAKWRNWKFDSNTATLQNLIKRINNDGYNIDKDYMINYIKRGNSVCEIGMELDYAEDGKLVFCLYDKSKRLPYPFRFYN